MLIPPLPAAVTRRALPLLLLAAALSPGPLRAEAPAPEAVDPARPPRPPDLVILQQKQTLEGPLLIGVFGARADVAEPELWSVRVWQETRDRVMVATDRVRCSRQAPLRITGEAGRVFVRELNPGGPITPANRLDHLIWWAVCQPAQAGRDPATLGAEARRLGYPGTLPERQEILTGG